MFETSNKTDRDSGSIFVRYLDLASKCNDETESLNPQEEQHTVLSM